MASIIGERHKHWCSVANNWMTKGHANTLWIHILVFSNHACWCNYCLWNTLTYLKAKNIFSWSGLNQRRCSLPQSSRNRKFATSVIRMVFKRLETFAESFQLSDFNEIPARYNNLRFYFCFHTRIFGEVKLGSSWLRAKITMTSSLRTEKKYRIFHADIDQWLFIQEQKCSTF